QRRDAHLLEPHGPRDRRRADVRAAELRQPGRRGSGRAGRGAPRSDAGSGSGAPVTARGASLLALAFVVGALGGTGGARGQGVPAELGMRRVPASRMVPFYGGSPETPARVEAFDIDAHPVTNAQFLAFVSKTPRYRRGTVAPLFADAGYLRHWRGPLSLGENAQPEQSVVHVSWCTARAYCASRDARLPTELEWEVAARADETRADASRDPAYV